MNPHPIDSGYMFTTLNHNEFNSSIYLRNVFKYGIQNHLRKQSITFEGYCEKRKKNHDCSNTKMYN